VCCTLVELASKTMRSLKICVIDISPFKVCVELKGG
jgi:hypothetical protein